MGKRSHWETARWSIIAKTLVFQGRKLHQKRVTAWQRFIAELLNSNNRPSTAFFKNHQDPLTHDFGSNTLTLFQMHSKHMTVWITCKFTTLLQQVQSKTAKKCLMCSWCLNCCFHFQHWTLKAYLQSSNNTITRCDRCNNEDFEHVSDANLGWVTPIFTCQSVGKSGNPQPKWENMSLQGTGCKPIGKKLLYLAFGKSVSRFTDCFYNLRLLEGMLINIINQKWGEGKPQTFRKQPPLWTKCHLTSLGTKRQLVSPAVGVVGASPFQWREKQRQRYKACWQTSSSNCSLVYQYETILLHTSSF